MRRTLHPQPHILIAQLHSRAAEPQEVEEQDIGCSTLTSPDASSGESYRIPTFFAGLLH